MLIEIGDEFGIPVYNLGFNEVCAGVIAAVTIYGIVDAIKKKSGTRTDLTCGQIDHKLVNRKSSDLIAEDSGESPKQIQRFIRLTELITPPLDCVDQGRLAFNPAAAISYLTSEQQFDVLDLMNQFACSCNATWCPIRMSSIRWANCLDSSENTIRQYHSNTDRQSGHNEDYSVQMIP